MKVYVMRHGRTNWNEKLRTQGRSQNQLSKTGKEDALKIAQDFSKNKVDLIVCSPLMRTVQTANIMNKYQGVKVVKDKRLVEVDQGIFTGKKYSQMTPEEHEAKRQRRADCELESWRSVYGRVKNFADSIKSDYPYSRILVVTHESLAIYLSAILSSQKADVDNPFTMPRFSNAEIKEFEI